MKKFRHLLILLFVCSQIISIQAQPKINAGPDAIITCGESKLIFAKIRWTNTFHIQNTNLKSVFFTDKNTGFAVGDSGTILKTIDAGTTWIKKKPLTTYSSDASSFNSICFMNKDTGYVIGTEDIHKTTDGGETWVHKAGISGHCITSSPEKKCFIGTSTGIYSIVESDTITLNPCYTSSGITSIFFINASIGYAVGYSGTIIKTIDGGDTWTSQSGGLGKPLYSVFFTDNDNGHITGANGMYLKTIDGGQTWTKIAISKLSTGNTVFFTSPNDGYIGASGGYFFTTNNGGNTWGVGMIATKNINSIVFTDPNTGYAVNQSGDIYKYYGSGTYSWTPSAGLNDANTPNPVASPTATTSYVVTYTSPENIISKDTITITVNPATINAGTDQTIHCGETVQLGVTTNYIGSGTLKYKWTPSTGLSNDTIANPIATINSNTTYIVTVTTPNNCTSSDEVKVSISPLSKPDLGIVSANSSNNNVIVWNRPASTAIDSVYIYKETNVTNEYKKIGAVVYTAPNQFVDTLSNTNVQSNKYKISVKDHCGFESTLSDSHKTMHLSINKGVNNAWNLIWESYAGFTVSTYNIYRGTNAQNIALINSTSGSNTQFTDLNAPSGYVYYQIEVISPYSIFVDALNTTQNNASLLRSASAFPAIYYSSRSNIATNNTSGIDKPNYTYDLFSVSPNPAKDNILISVNQQSQDAMMLNIYNMTGNLVKSDVLENEKQTYNISSLSNGIYILELKSGNLTDKKRLIINR